LQGGDDPQWSKNSAYWPKENQINELLEVVDGLIERKDNGFAVGSSNRPRNRSHK